MYVWIPLILLKIENNKKYFFNYRSLMNLLFICLIILFMACPMNSAPSAGLKKKNQPDADVGSVKCTSQTHPKVEIVTKILIFMKVN